MPPKTAEVSKAVIETRMIHETHRVATALLVDAAERPSVPLNALAQLRDFVVAHLRHHHETEDEDLWPRLTAATPDVAAALDSLSEEHERLDTALDRLAAVEMPDSAKESPIDTDPASSDSEGARTALLRAAVEVCDTVRDHLAHEEPILFSALRAHISPAEWEEFSQRVIATTPPVAGHLTIGLLDEVGTPAEVDLVLAGMPEPLRPLISPMRDQAANDLRVLRGTNP